MNSHVRNLHYGEYASKETSSYLIDLSLGESPYISGNVLDNIGDETTIQRLNEYDLILELEPPLRTAIADCVGVDESSIVVTPGCDGAIGSFCRCFLKKGDSVIIPTPTFPRYDFHAKMQQAEMHYTPSRYPFYLDLDHIVEECDKTSPKALFICNPNNPTGHYLDKNKILNFSEKVSEQNKKRGKACIVFLDEALADYTGETCSDMVRQYPHLIIGRTFSKIFGLASARIGYLVADPKVALDLKKVGSPFEVASMSLKAATLALEDDEFIADRKKNVKVNYEFLTQRLQDKGYSVSDSATSMAVIYGSNKKSQNLHKYLLGYGIKTINGDEFMDIRGQNAIRINIDTERRNLESLYDRLSDFMT